jgi:hypothetical protein
MNRRSILLLGLSLLLSIFAPGRAFAKAPPTTQPQPIRILFIGNSYTFYNGSLPAIVQAMARAQGKNVQCDSSVSGGKSLEWHWNQGKARQAIAKGPWNFIVLQDYSLQAIIKPRLLREYGMMFCDLIKSTGAKPVFFMTWARQNQPEKQQTITDVYEQAARASQAGIAPVGLAWQRCLRQHREIKLHQNDRSHPTPAGSYLAGCVFYDTFFGPPVRPFPAAIDLGKVKLDLPPSQARMLQEIAAETVAAVKAMPSPATQPAARN